MMPYTSSTNPTKDITKPGMSSFCGCGFLVSGTTRTIPTRPIATIGTFTRNTDPQSLPVSQLDQPGCCSKMPPNTGPKATAPPTAPAHRPIALPRSCGGKTTVMIANVTGSTAAPPTPMSARKPIKASGVGANAHAVEARTKMISPVTRTRFRPYLSPSTPQVKSRAANTRM